MEASFRKNSNKANRWNDSHLLHLNIASTPFMSKRRGFEPRSRDVNGSWSIGTELTSASLFNDVRVQIDAMTEYWVSKSRHYCELCNAWMADTQLAIRTHENGAKHKQMVSMRIKQAREDGAKEKRDAKLAQQNMERIEALAQKQYERDLMDARSKQGRVAEAGTTPSSGGGWILDNRCGYYYDEASGYYYDPKSEMYFKDGVWSERPGTTVILPAQTGSESNAKASAHRGSIEDAKTTTEYAVGYGTLHPAYEASLKRKSCPSSSPERRLNMGHVGASRGITVTASGSGKKTKRVVEGASKGGKLTKEESEALARREAARRRVESRTLDTLGLQ